MNYHLLLVDNTPRFLEGRKEYLEDRGYQVTPASTLAQARRAMREVYFHLAIIDNRMIDDMDDRDHSGVALACEEEFRRIPKIIATNFATWEDARKVLMLDSRQYPAAYDYWDKKEPSQLLEIIQRVLDEHVRRNTDLVIHDEDGRQMRFAALVEDLEPGLEPRLLPERMAEMEDLFRKLFLTAARITVSDPVWFEGGRMALRILAESDQGQERLVVTCGGAEPLLRERQLYEQYSLSRRPPGLLALDRSAETLHYGLNSWSFGPAAADIETLQPLGATLSVRTEKQARALLEDLCKNTLRPWVMQGKLAVETRGLAEICHECFGLDEQAPVQIGERLQSLARDALARGLLDLEISPEQITVRLPGARNMMYPNPLSLWASLESLPNPRIISSASLGAPPLETYLVDAAGRAWATSYAWVRQAPIWLDIAALEAGLRTRAAEVSGLAAAIEMERVLSTLRSLNSLTPLDSLEPEARKTAGLILALRAQAALLQSDDLRSYEICLFFAIIARLIRLGGVNSRLADTAAQAQRLVAAALLAQKLTQGGDQSQAGDPLQVMEPFGQTLYIDEESREVSVGGRNISLSPTEYRLVHYLYRNAGKLCLRRDIVREVFEILDPSPSDEESLLNANIGRLRKKLEPNPDSPSFLLTVRGVGYKLVCQAE